ncbi:MAG: class I SAM-dependent methyltransferase [Planctomycetota bacterium]|jgi:SAM-dependent methyltransferase
MGDTNHLLFVRKFRKEFEGPVLEVGSRDYGNTQSLRPLFAGDTYVGVDLVEGDGVDLVLDLTRPFEEVSAGLGERRFRTIFCLSVLEHCEQPFQMAENITRLLEPGGKVHISVPFAWKFHGYPSDFWRFTHEGVRTLFAGLEFAPDRCFVRTDVRDDFRPLDQDLGRMRLSGGWHRRKGRLLASLGADLVRLLGALGPLRWLTRHRYLLPPTAIEMLGTLRER